MHTEEKSYKCNQCDHASSHASYLKAHLKTHSAEKSNKCNQCDYACSDPIYLRKNNILKPTVEKGQTNATNVTMLLLGQAIRGHI